MQEAVSWTNLFFSGDPPSDIEALNNPADFTHFSPETDDWCLEGWVSQSRILNNSRIKVFWLRINGRRKYVAKMFPEYTQEQAAEQLRRFFVPESQILSRMDDTVDEYDRFLREARVYRQLEHFCANNQQIYFPKFHGILPDLERSKFGSGSFHRRGLVLEAILPHLRSRRILAADSTLLPESFQQTIKSMPMTGFERDWYCSLICDRLRRLAALHRIGVTHADVQDYHFRIPDDFYDTVLYDFSASYTFSPKWPLKVNSGRPRPLAIIAEGERKRAEIQVLERAGARDFYTHLQTLIAEDMLNDALSSPLDAEQESLELVILQVRRRPDYFSMPSLNSVFPFLEAVRPEGDSAWHIRRARLLHCYESAWACLLRDEEPRPSVRFCGEPEFETSEANRRCYFLLLIPRAWKIPLPPFAEEEQESKTAKICTKIRETCKLSVSFEIPGCIIANRAFLEDPWKSSPSCDRRLGVSVQQCPGF